MLMKMRSKMQKANNQKGFTLVELMVVVVILGILVAIAVPIYNNVSANAQQKACFANQRTIEGAIESYRAANGGSLPADVAALAPTYLKSEPHCPVAGVTVSYTIDTDGQVVEATGGGHGYYATTAP